MLRAKRQQWLLPRYSLGMRDAYFISGISRCADDTFPRATTADERRLIILVSRQVRDILKYLYFERAKMAFTMPRRDATAIGTTLFYGSATGPTKALQVRQSQTG